MIADQGTDIEQGVIIVDRRLGRDLLVAFLRRDEIAELVIGQAEDEMLGRLYPDSESNLSIGVGMGPLIGTQKGPL